MSDTVKVRILTETHEDAGKKVSKGTILDVVPATATHLIKIGAAELVTASAKEASSAKTAGGAN